MKNFTLIIIVLLIIFQSCKSQKNLYLLFNNNSKYMNKVRMGYKKPYNYRFVFSENNELNLTSDLDYQYGPVQIDTIQMKNIDTIKLRNYKWLNRFVNKYKHPDYINFSKLYKNIYVIEIDSINKKALISKVQSVIYEY